MECSRAFEMVAAMSPDISIPQDLQFARSVVGAVGSVKFHAAGVMTQEPGGDCDVHLRRAQPWG
jgi:hypothetical protein